ncbi:prepilin-type N-terminal cleavage/methylation domain-containing protein [Candidatus Nomurabacteria bacterium]|nr:prepilin-type N-terminal cleavage/methylation domain-containing protein [Candidatus Nomurabacteria bacterium]
MFNKHKGFTLIELMIVVAILGILVAILAGVGGAGLYGWAFSEEKSGQLQSVESAIPEGGLIAATGSAVFSAAVSMKLEDQSYLTFSTDDRQWAVYRGDKARGKCATVKVYPYAPWNISKGGTFHNGRLLKVWDCPAVMMNEG